MTQKILTGLLILLLTGCASQQRQWASPYDQAHPLVGQVVHVGDRKLVTMPELIQQASQSRYLLIGEVHDNPDHHHLQLEILRGVAGAGVHPSLIFEQFDIDHQGLIDNHLSEPEVLREKSGFDQRGWAWELYLPLLELAVERGWQVRAGNISRESLRTMDIDALPVEFRDLLQPSMDADAQQRLRADLLHSHCDMIDDTHIDKLFLAQRIRDAGLARTLIDADAPVALIAGNGHVRRDYGVAQILSDNLGAQQVISIGIVEVSSAARQLSVYFQGEDSLEGVFDFVLFTPRIRDQDPCLQFREQLKGMSHKR
jgi:uncharacterized iron-regulated protein